MKRTLALIVLTAAALGAGGCVTHETRPQARVKAIQAAGRTMAEESAPAGASA